MEKMQRSNSELCLNFVSNNVALLSFTVHMHESKLKDSIFLTFITSITSNMHSLIEMLQHKMCYSSKLGWNYLVFTRRRKQIDSVETHVMLILKLCMFHNIWVVEVIKDLIMTFVKSIPGLKG